MRSAFFAFLLAMAIPLPAFAAPAPDEFDIDSPEETYFIQAGEEVNLNAPARRNARYDWFKDNTPLTTTPTPNLPTYTIPPATPASIGIYTVTVTTRKKSESFHVTVIFVSPLPPLNRVVNSGMLTIPVTAFATTFFVCGSVTFTNAYSLSGSGPSAQLFYAKSYPYTGQTPPFKNNGNSNLRIYTDAGDNPNITQAGVRLQQNWLPPTNVFCYSSPTSEVSGTALLDNRPGNTFRGTFYFNGTPPPTGVVFKWIYN